MNKSLTEFIGNVKEGLAKNTHYDVVLGKPKVVTSNYFDGAMLQKIMLFCDQTQLPGVNISTTPLRVYGESREMPYEKLFDPVQLSFYVDKQMKVKMFFDEWFAGIQNQYSRTFTYYKEYVTDMDIIVYDVANMPQYKITLYEAYPKTMGAVQLDYSNKDIMKLQVTMQYKYWRSSPMTTGLAPSIANNLPAELASVGRSGISIPTSYFDNQGEFQKNVAQAAIQGFSNFWNTLA